METRMVQKPQNLAMLNRGPSKLRHLTRRKQTGKAGHAAQQQQPLTLSVPEAGARYFGLSRNGAYAAAERGDIPTIKVGRLLRVPVRAMENKLDAVAVSNDGANVAS
jgi:hypothetical protein